MAKQRCGETMTPAERAWKEIQKRDLNQWRQAFPASDGIAIIQQAIDDAMKDAKKQPG